MTSKQIRSYNKLQEDLYAQKTGIHVDIQNIGKNTAPLAIRGDYSVQELREGVWLRTRVLDFPDGNFCNSYDLFWDKNNFSLESTIHSEQKPYYMLDYMESDPSIFAIINGSYYFLVDFPGRVPKDYPFNFCVRDGKVVGLLSSDEPVLYIQNGELNAKEAKAKGKIQIDNRVISWIGAGSTSKTKENAATLCNSASAKLIKEFDPKTGVRVGRLDYNFIHTPKNEDVIDLVINEKKGKLFISEIILGGGTHYFEGLFILQIDKTLNTFKVGDHVTPIEMDGLDLKTISNAITIGKSVHDPYFFTPERINSRDARSVIAQDTRGNTHFIVFDGFKYIPNFRGISANDVAESYFSDRRFKWAYFLDGGSSSRIIVRKDNDMEFLANDFAFKKITNEVFLWDSKRHRKLASTIALKRRNG